MDEVAEIRRAAGHNEGGIHEERVLLFGYLTHDVIHSCFHGEEGISAQHGIEALP